MRASAAAYHPVEVGSRNEEPTGVPPNQPIPSFPLFTQANPLGVQFSVPFSSIWSENETREPTDPRRQAFEIENAPEWAKEGGVVREGGGARVLYPEGQPFGDDHPYRGERQRSRRDGDSYEGTDFSDKGQHDFTAQLESGFDDPVNETEDRINDSNYVEAEGGEENEDYPDEEDADGSKPFSAEGDDVGGDGSYSLQDDPDFKERQALYEQATETGGDGNFGRMSEFNARNEGGDFFSQSLHDDQGGGEDEDEDSDQFEDSNQFQDSYFESEEEKAAPPPVINKSSVKLKMAQNPFKLYAGEGRAPKFNFDDVDLGEEVAQEGEEGSAEKQVQPQRRQKQLKEKFMKDREQLEAQLNARGDSMYRTSGQQAEGEEGRPPPRRRVMGQAELRAQLAMQRIAHAAMTAMRSRRGKKGKRRGGMPVVFI